METPSEGNDIKSTGTRAFVEKRKFFHFTTRELIIVAVLGVAGGFISGLIPFSLLVKVWYPFHGGTQLVSGHHLLWPVIAYGMTRRKVTLLTTAIVKGFVMFLLIADQGIMEVFVSTFQGCSLIAGFFLVERFDEGDSNLGWGLACGIGNVTQAPYFWLISGRIFILHVSLFIMAVMFAFASGVLVTGMLGRRVVLALQRALD